MFREVTDEVLREWLATRECHAIPLLKVAVMRGRLDAFHSVYVCYYRRSRSPNCGPALRRPS